MTLSMQERRYVSSHAVVVLPAVTLEWRGERGGVVWGCGVVCGPPNPLNSIINVVA
jgi:hypothetical protein